MCNDSSMIATAIDSDTPLGSRAAEEVSSVAKLITAPRSDEREFSELVQSIVDNEGTLVAPDWNAFQKWKRTLTARGARYAKAPTKDGRTTHQVKHDHAYGVLTVEYVTTAN